MVKGSRFLDAGVARAIGLGLIVACALPLVAAVPPADEQDRVRWQGEMRNIAVYRPATAGSGSPLLLALGDPGRSARYALDSWRELAEQEGFVVAAVSSQRPDIWRSPQDGPGLLRVVVNQVKSRHPIDTRRVYLFGSGVGGPFALQLAIIQPRFFAAVASFGGEPRPGALRTSRPLPRAVPATLAYSKRTLQFDVDALAAAAAEWRQSGGVAELLRLDVGLDFERRGRKAAGRIWQALSAHQLGEAPRYQSSPYDR